jgi:hypothetical protein
MLPLTKEDHERREATKDQRRESQNRYGIYMTQKKAAYEWNIDYRQREIPSYVP